MEIFQANNICCNYALIRWKFPPINILISYSKENLLKGNAKEMLQSFVTNTFSEFAVWFLWRVLQKPQCSWLWGCLVKYSFFYYVPNAFLGAFLNILCKFEITVHYTRYAHHVLTSENRFLSLFYVSLRAHTHKWI